ncbi:hypothetical protein XPR_1916 [Xanthomonas arboricola pv. pruni MAFF 301420]|uniref:Uncharacterized protein n=2 Tax=Xanthomonas arboricola pv. pruni TaxID=69929 RepID=W4SFI7_9XANT|nr:hypothetical protein XPU_4841 [Xanthomonas arboricola pv. pruni str. MAFF 311562]GAE55281.1 hypothetical protein XPR_1916 [Xanthomonas arboricola pv. pruni MAFF 301420]GAE62633.1 hypothetical protein XPN_4539 [Xanthomonas arboricola pv. pruni MAFF 301427]
MLRCRRQAANPPRGIWPWFKPNEAAFIPSPGLHATVVRGNKQPRCRVWHLYIDTRNAPILSGRFAIRQRLADAPHHP